jgi:hypothetical protein
LGENATPPNARVFLMVTQVTITFCSELFKLLIGPSLISPDAYINSPSSSWRRGLYVFFVHLQEDY